jgi:DNA-binding winged helix-turn-helix (wHTH) protein/TolB-like protein/tetratricopeptide (TPR) repeat protein
MSLGQQISFLNLLRSHLNPADKQLYEFGPFRLDAARRVLLRGDEPVPLAPKAFDMLIVLVSHRGQVLEKDRLMEILWPDSVVEEANLPQNISALRKALGESPSERKYIVTIPGKGYKFAAEVQESPGENATLVMNRYSRATIVVEEKEDDGRNAALPAETLGVAAAAAPARKTASRTLAFAGTALLIAAALFGWLASRKKEEVTPRPIRSIAVLPFKQLLASGDDPLGVGITDVLIARLSSLHGIIVRPTSAVLKYTAVDKGTAEIGRELGVESVLEGSVQRSGESMRATVRLLRVSDGVLLWSDKFDGPSTDLFTLEDRISERVAEKLTLQLRPEEKYALARHYTENSEAHLAYLKGRYQVEKRTPDAAARAIEFFQQALQKDTNYALAHVGLAESYMTLAVTGARRPNEAFPRVKEGVTRALEIDPLLADAYTILGVTKFWHDWDYPGAGQDFKRAIEINPNHARAHEMYAHLLSNLGRPAEALAESSRALELDPLSLIGNALRGQQLNFAGRYDDAIEHLQKTLDVEPNFWIAHIGLGKAYERKKMYSEAIAEFQTAWDLSNGSSEPKSLLGYTYAVSGRPREAHLALQELKQSARVRYIAPKHIALIYAGLGDKNGMFEWLEKAYEDRDISLTFIKVEPRWDPFRADARFVNLIHRVGFTP